MVAKDTWFYRDGDVELGPTKAEELAPLVRRGLVGATTPVRRSADAVWMTATEAFPWLFAAPDIEQGAGKGWTDVKPHGWRRYFARSLDNLIVGGLTWALIAMVAYAVAPEEADAFFKVFDGPASRVVDVILTLIVAIPGNALLIGLTGLSIGKWVFGIRVLKDGAPIGVARALRREVGVWFRGLGCGIPLVSLATMLSSGAYLDDHRITPWDKAQQLTVIHRPATLGAKVLMWVGAICYVLLAVGLQVLANA